MKIAIYGDFCPGSGVPALTGERQYERLFASVKATNTPFDYRIANMECPVVTAATQPILKSGPCLKCGPEVLPLLQYGHFDCVTLANNHFRDQGDEGVRQTLDALDSHGIDHVGGGRTFAEASQTLYRQVAGATLAIVNCAEHESSIATDSHGGSNPIDPIRQYYAICEARGKADYVVVVVHGGIEGYQQPTPRMQQCYRFFVDAGADAVVNHHQHCYCGYEVYHAKPIFYGLGNFFFPWNNVKSAKWTTGYAVALTLDDGGTDFRLIPYRQCVDEPGWSLMDQQQAAEFEADIERLNAVVADPEALKTAHQQYMEREKGLNKALLTPYATYVGEALCEKGWLPNYYPRKKLVTLLNRITCESHRERLIHYINDRLGQ